jgi:hypothetical protein
MRLYLIVLLGQKIVPQMGVVAWLLLYYLVELQFQFQATHFFTNQIGPFE